MIMEMMVLMSMGQLIKYDDNTLPQVYQTGSLEILPQMYNPSVNKIHPFGTPNSHHPWLRPGGIPRAAYSTAKEIKLPPNTRIKVFRYEGTLPKNLTAPNKLYGWTYPVGTVATIKIYDGDGKEFAQHISTKVKDGNGISNWEGEEKVTGTLPSWYKSPSSCTKCHEDIGKHANVLKPNEKNYYNWLRGSDGRFSWHPFKRINERGNLPARIQLRSGYGR